MIEKKLYDGHVLRFPDGTSDEVINKVAKRETLARKSQQAPEEQGWLKDWLGRPQGVFEEPTTFGEIAQDVAKAVPAGLGRAAIGIAELPEMALRASQRGKEEVFGILGADVEKTPITDTFTGQALRGAANISGLGDDLQYRGETELGQRLGAGAEFAAAAPLGAGSLLRKGATQFAGGVAAESAGQQFDETGYGDAARLGVGVLSPTGISTARTAISPIRNIRGELADDVNLLSKYGIDTSAGQQAGQGYLSRKELSQGGTAAQKNQIEQFSSAVMKILGGNTAVAVGAPLREAQERIILEMKNSVNGLSARADDMDINDLFVSLARFKKVKATGEAGKTPKKEFADIFDRLRKSQEDGSAIDAEEYVSFRQRLSAITSKGDNEAVVTANEMIKVLDSMANRAFSASGDTGRMQQIAAARAKYRDYLAVESASIKAAKRGDNFITPKDLNSSFLSQSPRSAVQGTRGELADLSKSAARVMPDATKVTPMDARAALKDFSIYGTIGFGGGQLLKDFTDLNAGYVAAAVGLTQFAVKELTATKVGQNYLKNRLMRKNETDLSADSARAVIAALVSQNEAEDQQ
mgnify:CR=1 FL=1